MKRLPPVRVSDHAVLRYLERVGGFEIERLRAEIGARLAPAISLGATAVTIDGFQYRIIGDVGAPGGGVVVATVVRAESTPHGIYQKAPRPCR